MIGFTGTQRGMTDAQRKWVRIFFQSRDLTHPVWGAHGDCIGADHNFHQIVRQLRHPTWPASRVGQIWLFPPDNDSKRAFCDYDQTELPAPYLKRNHAIVDASKIMIATPGETKEVLRYSGTWATIRYTRKTSKTLWVINPDGSVNPDWSQVSHDRPD